MNMNRALKTNVALQLLREIVAATGDDEAEAHFNALVTRLQALETAAAQQDATTVIDERGNITVGLKSIGLAAQTVGMR